MMVAKASQRFLSNIKDYGSEGPGRWRHQESISGMDRRAQFTPSPGSFRFELLGVSYCRLHKGGKD
jgi:hypothetical protein